MAIAGGMDALVPMASQPTAMSSRNWMMRRMLIDIIRNYTDQPLQSRNGVGWALSPPKGAKKAGKAHPTRGE